MILFIPLRLSKTFNLDYTIPAIPVAGTDYYFGGKKKLILILTLWYNFNYGTIYDIDVLNLE